jgi:hypothetical protein
LLIRDHVGNRHFEAENRYAHVCLLYHGLPGSPDKQPVADEDELQLPNRLRWAPTICRFERFGVGLLGRCALALAKPNFFPIDAASPNRRCPSSCLLNGDYAVRVCRVGQHRNS